MLMMCSLLKVLKVYESALVFKQMDYTSQTFIDMLMKDLIQGMKVMYAVRLALCPVCNVYGNPEEHLCSTPTIKELV
jgi:hypothetical protein